MAHISGSRLFEHLASCALALSSKGWFSPKHCSYSCSHPPFVTFGDEGNLMTTHGSIGEFNASIEDWTAYTERLEQYFTANGIGSSQAQAEQRRAILLAVCGPATYQLIRSLSSPAKPSERTYKQIIKLVQEHQQPTPSFIVQRFNFHS